MEEKQIQTDEQIHRKNGFTNEFSLEIPNLSGHVNITIIDLSSRNIDTLADNLRFPENLLELNLSHNKITEVPAVISKLKKLKNLNFSHNAIEYFDETPNFCHTLERLDLSTNSLLGPPYWLWTKKPKNLSWVNLSCNTNITKSLVNSYLQELLQYKTLILEIDLYNCGFKNKEAELLATFSNAKTINFGTSEYSHHGANIISEVPNKGFEKCSIVERLNLSNTYIYTINSNIDLLKNLSELNLACNNITVLPNEFCNLAYLETCVLSYNELIYLPDDMCNMKKLSRLCIDNNKLCALPEKLLELENLNVLDLYNNNLYEILEDYDHLHEFDIALNYMDEPDDVDYLEKKGKLRQLRENRFDGSKPEKEQAGSEYSSSISDNEQYYREINNGEIPAEVTPKPENDQSQRSSPEDWDSDDEWIPYDIKLPRPPTASQGWIHFVQRKMQEGNFCPADAHVVSVSEQVMYEKKHYPKVEVECEGQFDDYSSDET